jgi:hypothetical protein
VATYSEVEDLLVGKIPMPAYIDPQKYVQDATDEVDSYVGMVYTTPIDVTETSTIVRPVRLLLKRLANHLASGRLIMAAAAGSEMRNVHAYGSSLVESASKVLCEISEGKVVLQDVPTVGDGTQASVPLIFNLDSESAVEAYYTRVVAPPVVPNEAYALVRYGYIQW